MTLSIFEDKCLINRKNVINYNFNALTKKLEGNLDIIIFKIFLSFNNKKYISF